MEQRQGLGQGTKILAGDRRLTMHLMGVWQGLRGGGDPCVTAEDLFRALPEDLWTDCCVVEITADGDRRISRVGDAIARHSGVRAVPARVVDLPPQSLLAQSVREIEDAQKAGIPILDEGEARDEQGRLVLFRSILLPLVDGEGANVTFLAGARCRLSR